MAIKITTKPNTDAASAAYPYGNIRDNTGSNNGTPVNAYVYADFHQFFAKLAAEAGVTLNDLPDNATNGFQYYEALVSLFGTRQAIINIGSWDMDADSGVQVANTLTGVDETNIISVEAMILDDTEKQLRPLVSGDGDTGNLQGGIHYDNGMGSPNEFVLKRTTGGDFDSTNYNDTGVNRGYIIVRYTV